MPNPSLPRPRRHGAAGSFTERLLARGRVAFPLSELRAATGLSAIAARNQLLRLRDKVVRASPKQPFFLVVGPEHRALGAPPPAWWLHDYFEWLGHPYYVALQSAAALHGAQPQAVQALQVMTDAPRRELALGRTRIRFFVKRDIPRTPTQLLPQARAPLLLSTPEATALDLVLYADRIGGLGRAIETLAPLLPALRRERLKPALRAAKAGAVERLAAAVAQAGDRRLAAAVRALAQ
jgi:hypothetical protein